MSVTDLSIGDDTLRRPKRAESARISRNSSRVTAPGRVGTGDKPRASRSPAAARALERRRKRLAAQSNVTIAQPGQSAAPTRKSLLEKVRRIPFVVVVIAILLVGLSLTLWLSTRSAQDAYRLGAALDENQRLTAHYDTLKKQFESGDSAPELADKAAKLGMILANSPARIVINADGTSKVVGDVKAAQGQAEPSLNASHRDSSHHSEAVSARDGQTAHAAGEQAATTPGTGSPEPAITNVLPSSGGNQASSPGVRSQGPGSQQAPAGVSQRLLPGARAAATPGANSGQAR